MANTRTRGRGTGPGSPGRRSLTAAARAAAKRADGSRSGAQDPLDGVPEDLVNDLTGLPPVEKVVGKVLLAPAESGPGPDPEASDRPDPKAPDPKAPDPEAPDPKASDPEASDEEASDEETAPRGRRRARLSAVLALLTVAGLVAVAVLGWQYRDGRRVEAARAQALTAAQQAAPLVLSYDYRHLDRDFAAAHGRLTGSFRDEYGRTTKAVVAPTAKKYKGVVKASVVTPPDGGAPAASVASASADSAVVVLFVNQVTKSTQVSGSRVDLNRVRMTLTRTPDGWKVSAVDAL
ncbi:hypothetical protein [Streptomyces sp. MZ04]|uniref:hypothetical protein n=1 Tax=Streptomyces sp. MZ04 TaxID=2559236 RepID=UPI00107EDFB4|nr:hypothetical protein [Streptomyces sp. MZ04]TGB14133.1 hypothetical protein E2651_07030 [Streptomyces sp. MZ04]